MVEIIGEGIVVIDEYEHDYDQLLGWSEGGPKTGDAARSMASRRAADLWSTSARSALEQSAVLSARTGFLRSGISEQVKILRRVRGGIENVYKEGQRDFKVGLTQIRREVRLIMIECYTDTRFGKRKAGIDDGYSAIHNGGSCVQT